MKKIIAILAFFAPALAFAQVGLVSGTNGGLIGVIGGLLNTIIPILITLAVIYFIWGVVQYVTTGDAEKKEQGQQHMIWGLIGLFVIVSMWGLVAILSNTFGTSGQNSIGDAGNIPCVGNTFDSNGNLIAC